MVCFHSILRTHPAGAPPLLTPPPPPCSLYQAKLAEQAERYDEMVQAMKVSPGQLPFFFLVHCLYFL